MIAALRRPITLRIPTIQPTSRHLWIVPGLAVAIAAGQVGDEHAVGLVPLLVFGIVPHVPAWLGPRAGRAFDLLHQPLVPVGLGVIAVSGLLAPIWLVAAMAWLGHIVIDWGIGAARLPLGGHHHG